MVRHRLERLGESQIRPGNTHHSVFFPSTMAAPLRKYRSVKVRQKISGSYAHCTQQNRQQALITGLPEWLGKLVLDGSNSKIGFLEQERIVVVLCAGGDALQKSLSLWHAKLDWDEISQDCSSSKYVSTDWVRFLGMTSYYQDGCGDIRPPVVGCPQACWARVSHWLAVYALQFLIKCIILVAEDSS